jgi:hypothetical protein
MRHNVNLFGPLIALGAAISLVAGGFALEMQIFRAQETNSGSRLNMARFTRSSGHRAGEFVVDTPAATTIDLGCKYTLHVGHDGTGLLDVEMGWVAFQWGNLESFIPAGASCTTRPGRGPGTPHFSDAPAEFQSALNRVDESGDLIALQVVLAAARKRDALTIWHLLSRTQGHERVVVFTRFSQLAKLPPTVTNIDILREDPAAMDRAWNALDLGNTDWWRG